MDSKFVDCCQADSALKRLHTPIRCRWKRRRSVKSLKYKAEISTAQMFPNTHLLHLHMGIDARPEPGQHILLWKRALRQLRTEMTEYGSEAGGMGDCEVHAMPVKAAPVFVRRSRTNARSGSRSRGLRRAASDRVGFGRADPRCITRHDRRSQPSMA